MAATLTACAVTHVSDAFGARPNDQSAHTFENLPHFKDKRFVSQPAINDISFMEITGILIRHVFDKTVDPEPTSPLPTVPLNETSFENPPLNGYRVTWLGHATTMIEIDGLRIMTDPVFSDRASPFTSFGPKRFQPLPIKLADVPALDAVVISHDHYDHLDMDAIKELHGRVDRFFVPLGVGAHLSKWGVPTDKIIELDWWQAAAVSPKVNLIAAPAHHFSGRGVFDKNKTLWASWIIAGYDHRLFFSGDTGMHDGFSEIGRKYGPFDLAMIENGAYSKDWPDVHMSPEETIQAAHMLKAKRFMPIHWGTFNLANHPWYEPANRVRKLASEQNVALAQPRPGEAIGPHLPWPVATWWKERVDKKHEIAATPILEGAQN